MTDIIFCSRFWLATSFYARKQLLL